MLLNWYCAISVDASLSLVMHAPVRPLPSARQCSNPRLSAKTKQGQGQGRVKTRAGSGICPSHGLESSGSECACVARWPGVPSDQRVYVRRRGTCAHARSQRRSIRARAIRQNSWSNLVYCWTRFIHGYIDENGARRLRSNAFAATPPTDARTESAINPESPECACDA